VSPDEEIYRNNGARPLVQALCRDLLARNVNLDVHPADEMLGFFHHTQGNDLDSALAIYFDSGRRIWAAERQVLSWGFGPPPWSFRLLDFASGYGRVTRHLFHDLSPENVWVSDIYAAGVAFQERSFGVHGIVSTTDPESFPADQGFNAILVSSLFTHLPEARFLAWLRRLGELLLPGGLLLFSVHDLSLLRDPAADAASGMVFREVSESSSLEKNEYGTCWVSEAFVRRAVAEAVGPWPVLRISRGLASFQDLYVIVKQAGVEHHFPNLKLEREADGFLESCHLVGNRALRLAGWAADRVEGEPPREVRVRIDGAEVASCRDLEPRPAVADRTFSADPVPAVGWRATFEIPPGADPVSARLTVHTVTAAGEEKLLYAGSVESACFRSAQTDAVLLRGELKAREEELDRRDLLLAQRRAEIEALERRMEAMRASRFWKIRDLWFRFKRRAGLTAEE